MSDVQIQGVNSQTRRNSLQKVFVYGTLKKGFHNHENYLKSCRELGRATISGIMFHLGGFPAINLAERFTPIQGEVYECGWDEILNMDRLEGVGTGFYDRVEARVDSDYLDARGVVWMYTFNSKRAEKEQWVVPSGIWQGTDTPKAKWGGWGKGIEIGTFSAIPGANEIRVGAGDSPYLLQRSALDGTYKLINRDSREVLGSYAHLRDMVGADGKTKPVLRLPARSAATSISNSPIVDPLVLLANNRPSYEPPPRQQAVVPFWTPEARRVAEQKAEEENIPQAARLLGLKYGAA